MTVNEVMALLKDKFEYVAPLALGTEAKPGLSGPYYLNAIKRSGDMSVANVTLKLYIKDLNMTTEEVFFEGYNPLAEVDVPTVTFSHEVTTYTQSLIDSGVFDYVKVEDVNETINRALVRAYKVNTDGTLSEIILIISKQTEGTLTHKEVSTV